MAWNAQKSSAIDLYQGLVDYVRQHSECSPQYIE